MTNNTFHEINPSPMVYVFNCQHPHEENTTVIITASTIVEAAMCYYHEFGDFPLRIIGGERDWEGLTQIERLEKIIHSQKTIIQKQSEEIDRLRKGVNDVYFAAKKAQVLLSEEKR